METACGRGDTATARLLVDALALLAELSQALVSYVTTRGPVSVTTYSLAHRLHLPVTSYALISESFIYFTVR